MRMAFHEDLPDSVIAEIAAILATGYLRLRKARTQGKSSSSPPPMATEERLDTAPEPNPQRPVS
jgi:hypothetical protein